jgi:hypothetical protein
VELKFRATSISLARTYCNAALADTQWRSAQFSVTDPPTTKP